MSERIRAQRPVCEACEAAPSDEVDHIDGNKSNWAESNLQALCSSCHSRKTARHDGGFGNKRTPRP
ncbi:HNH endonuclease signature motif containing protein [Herbidospora mongoliensis]|uniref:HNH endonuclease signature motif containing protein n=1 Tax=Herbidospora mongoliensis TaxID=688067 RepID=UPI000A55F67B|nr:HNH endonuclease signature motif containing protein [Herbidospora mongoliensis]